MKKLCWIGLPIVILSGCNRQKSAPTTAAAPAGPNPVQLQRMREGQMRVIVALQKAHSTLPDFIRVLQKPKPSQSQFSVKCAVSEAGKTRHIWVDDVTFDGKKFHGRLANRLASDKTAKVGDKVAVAPDGVSDWMYIENHKLVGGYTLRALRDSMSPQDRKKFDKSLSFSIE